MALAHLLPPAQPMCLQDWLFQLGCNGGAPILHFFLAFLSLNQP